MSERRPIGGGRHALPAVVAACAALLGSACDALLGIHDLGADGDAGATAQDGGPRDRSSSGAGDAADGGRPYRQVVLADEPVAYLRLGESSPGEPAADEVNGGPVGAYTGMLTLGQPGAIAGDTNTAVALSGGYVDLGDVLPFGTAGGLNAPFSIEVWLQPSAFSGMPEEVVVKRDYDATTMALYGYDLLVGGDGKPCIQRWGGAGSAGAYDSARAPTPLPTSGYSHVVATYDQSRLVLYVNGTAVATSPSTRATPLTSSPLRVGGDPSFAASYAGLVDELAIYDHELSPDHVLAHFDAGAGL